MLKKKHSRVGTVISSSLSLLIIALAGWIFLNRQLVLDQLTVWQYTPSAQVATVEQKSGMTEKGRFAFYASRPVVADQADFNAQCPRREQKSPILGCYTAAGQIYIYDVTNSKLDGIEEVTAVHEMLHAVWRRMPTDEQQRLTTQLEAAYAKINDTDLHARMDYYQRVEPGEFANELHSILGSEYPNLGGNLESYYASYFSRSTVLARHSNYNDTYKTLTDESTGLLQDLQDLSKSIESRSTAFRAEAAQLSADIDSFNTRAHSGGFSSTAQFRSEQAALTRRSSQLESERLLVNADIEKYNASYDKYKQIASELQSLNDSLDSFHTLNEAPAV